MSAEESTAPETDSPDTQVTFKVKTSSDGNHTITMSENASVLDLKTKLAGEDFEKVPADRQRLIYSGRVMKNEDLLKKYNIKEGNTIHMVKSAQSNAVQNPASSPSAGPAAARAAPGVPTNMAAGTANNPLAGLTGARYAGHMALPGAEMFGADGGMGAPPSEEALAQMLEDPNMQQTLNEALNNPAMIDMMIQQTPHLRNNPHAREMLQSPEFRRMMTNPEVLRQANQMRRMLGGGGGAGGFPAPGVTDTTPAGAAGTNTNPNQPPAFPNLFGGMGGAGSPFAAMFAPQGIPGQTPAQTPPAPGSAGGTTPSATTPGAAPSQPNPSAATDAGLQNLFQHFLTNNPGGMPPVQGMPQFQPTPEMMRQAMEMMRGGGFSDMFGPNAATQSPLSPPATAAPVDDRPPEVRYESQLAQLNGMGFYDFDRNVQALRRAGGVVELAIEYLFQ